LRILSEESGFVYEMSLFSATMVTLSDSLVTPGVDSEKVSEKLKFIRIVKYEFLLNFSRKL